MQNHKSLSVVEAGHEAPRKYLETVQSRWALRFAAFVDKENDEVSTRDTKLGMDNLTVQAASKTVTRRLGQLRTSHNSNSRCQESASM